MALSRADALPPLNVAWIFDRRRDDEAHVGFDHTHGDGFDFMDGLVDLGWHPLSMWGADGWDLGAWPYVVVATIETLGRHWLIIRVEGDLELWSYPTAAELVRKIDTVAEFYWRFEEKGPTITDRATRPAEDFRGPYGRRR